MSILIELLMSLLYLLHENEGVQDLPEQGQLIEAASSNYWRSNDKFRHQAGKTTQI